MTDLLDRSDRRFHVRVVFPTWTSVLIFAVACILIPSSLLGLQLSKNDKFSPIDEFVHYSYVESVRSGHIPVLGQTIDQSVMRTVACKGIDLAGYTPPSCNSKHFSPKQFPGIGLTYESAQPPIYYAATALLSQIPIALFHTPHLSGDRYVGEFWLVSGLVLLWFALRLADIEPMKIAIGIGVLLGAPGPIFLASIVNNDAATLFAGSLTLSVGLFAIKYPGRWIIPVFALLAILVTSIKATDSIPIVALAIWFLYSAMRKNKDVFRAIRVWLATGGVLLLFTGVSLATWWLHLRTSMSPSLQHLICQSTQPKPGAPFSELFYDPLGAWQPMSAYGVGTFAGVTQQLFPIPEIISTLASLLFFASMASGLFSKRWSPAQVFGATTLVVLYVGALLLGLLSWANCQVPIGAEFRYGLSALPIFLLVMAKSMRSKPYYFLMGSLASFSLAFAFFAGIFAS